MSRRTALVTFVMFLALGIASVGLMARYVVAQLPQLPWESQTAAQKVYLGGRTGNLRICADIVPAGQAGAALTNSQAGDLKANFDAAVLRGVNLNKDRIGVVPSEYAAVTLDIGCPAPRVLDLALREGRVVDHRESTKMLQENIASSVADLNPYKFFLYLVEPAAYAAAFGDEPYAVSSEEFICVGICMSVTRAVYVPTGAPSAHIEAGLLEVLSLLTLEQILQQRADLAVPSSELP